MNVPCIKNAFDSRDNLLDEIAGFCLCQPPVIVVLDQIEEGTVLDILKLDVPNVALKSGYI